MRADGAIIIDTKIRPDGLTKGFAMLRSGAKSVAASAGRVGTALKNAFTKANITRAISGMVEKVKNLGRYLAIAGKIGGVFLKGLAFGAALAGIRALTQYYGSAIKKNNEFAESFGRLKGALLTAFQPIYEAVVPALITLMNILTAVVQVIGHVFALLAGKSDQQMAANASAINKQTKAISGAGGAAKKATKYLAGFDEIQKVSGKSSGGGGGGGAAGPDLSANFKDFNTEEYKNKIDELTVYLSLASLALGAILAFSGANIPLGIGLMALGAAGLVAEIKTNWDAVKNALSGSVGTVVALISGALLAIGAILAFSGANIPLGIGLMAAGAVGLGVTVAANWDAIKKKLQGPIGKVFALLSTMIVVLGAILAFSGANLPLGIGLIAAGAAGLAGTVALNWDTIKQKLQGPIGKCVALLSAGLLVIGAILAFSGGGLPLGIGLMAAGAVGLAATAALNWDVVRQKIVDVLAGILAILSGVSIVLGVLLCLSGAGLGLGLALIFAGLKGSTAAWNISSNPVTDLVKNIVDKIKEIINGAINWISNSIGNIIDKIKGIKNIFSSGSKTTIKTSATPNLAARSVAMPAVPALASGAVIPPNAPFMAMLGDQRHGTNIEAPLSTIQEAVALTMEDYAAANLAGHEATVAVLRDILEAVLGIEIGDDVLGKAANRYNSRLATMRGDA